MGCFGPLWKRGALAPRFRGQGGRGFSPCGRLNADRTFFVTAVTWGRRSIFQTDRMARLFLDTLSAYRDQGKYELHEFVVMPDHIHLLITPADGVTLEKCLQLIKGGFSFRVGKEISRMELWQGSFTNIAYGMSAITQFTGDTY